MGNRILFKNIEEKTIVWFENSNQYIVVEVIVAEILQKLSKGTPLKSVAKEFSETIDIPEKKAFEFILDVEKNILAPNQKDTIAIDNEYKGLEVPTSFEFTKYYQFDTTIFKIAFSNEFELSLVHPKFAHLEIPSQKKFDYNFQVFNNDQSTFLYVDEVFIGAWNYNDIHYFQGKLSMQIIQCLHQKPEKDWLGVFHASAVSDGKNGMLFLGDSGNGKSTSLALLQANGFHCIADDFVPVSALSQDIYSFPAAISIKRNSLEVLLPFYPELQSTAEYHFTRLNKIVRFLPPKNTNNIQQVPCKGFVFIKYDANTEFEVNEISKITAFEKLIPDSWLSPILENVDSFLDWFLEIPCYEITYSNNDRMISEVSKLFNDVL